MKQGCVLSHSCSLHFGVCSCYTATCGLWWTHKDLNWLLTDFILNFQTHTLVVLVGGLGLQHDPPRRGPDVWLWVCECVSEQDMCVRVMAETNHLFGWIWVCLISPLPWRGCPADVLVVFSAALFLISTRLFRSEGITSHPLWDIWRSVS